MHCGYHPKEEKTDQEWKKKKKRLCVALSRRSLSLSLRPLSSAAGIRNPTQETYFLVLGKLSRARSAQLCAHYGLISQRNFRLVSFHGNLRNRDIKTGSTPLRPAALLLSRHHQPSSDPFGESPCGVDQTIHILKKTKQNQENTLKTRRGKKIIKRVCTTQHREAEHLPHEQPRRNLHTHSSRVQESERSIHTASLSHLVGF